MKSSLQLTIPQVRLVKLIKPDKIISGLIKENFGRLKKSNGSNRNSKFANCFEVNWLMKDLVNNPK